MSASQSHRCSSPLWLFLHVLLLLSHASGSSSFVFSTKGMFGLRSLGKAVAHHRVVVPNRLYSASTMVPTVITEVKTDSAPAPIGPYSQAVLAGNTLYCSGNLPVDPATGEIVGHGDIQSETRQVMKNLDAVLKAGGATSQNVVRCTIFMADLGDFVKMNEIYAEYFKDNKVLPTRTCVQAAALPKGVNVEIDAIAQL